MFQSECCPREIRGAVVASYQLMITIGVRFTRQLYSVCQNHANTFRSMSQTLTFLQADSSSRACNSSSC
jgi:hypothetical protein